MDCIIKIEPDTNAFNDHHTPRKVLKKFKPETGDEINKQFADENAETRRQFFYSCMGDSVDYTIDEHQITTINSSQENGTENCTAPPSTKRPLFKENDCTMSSHEENLRTDVKSAKRKRKRKNSLSDIDDKSSYHYLNRLTALRYQMELSILCLHRISTLEEKYFPASVTCGNSNLGQFNDIVLCHSGKSLLIKVEHVDKFCTNNSINLNRLFVRSKGSFFINNYLNNFANETVGRRNCLSKASDYLIIYTNGRLDIRNKKIKFDNINAKKDSDLTDFLLTNNDCKFYRFSKNKVTRQYLLRRLIFSSDVEQTLSNSKFSAKTVKTAFLDRLILAVNQPSREELSSIVRNEIEGNNTNQNDYTEFDKKVQRQLISADKSENLRKSETDVSNILYCFNLFMFFIHDMFLHENIFSVNIENKRISHDITINYKNEVMYVKAFEVDSNISGHISPENCKKETEIFSIRKHFLSFTEVLDQGIKYTVIYTNAGLELINEMLLKEGNSKQLHPFRFDRIDVMDERFMMLNHSCINVNNLYQFSQGDTRKNILKLLRTPTSLTKKVNEGTLSSLSPNTIKELFLDKLIFAVEQLNFEQMDIIIKNEISNCPDVPYNFKELPEIAIRCFESRKFGSMTKEVMKTICKDIKTSKQSAPNIQNGYSHKENVEGISKTVNGVISREIEKVLPEGIEKIPKEITEGLLKERKKERIEVIVLESDEEVPKELVGKLTREENKEMSNGEGKKVSRERRELSQVRKRKQILKQKIINILKLFPSLQKNKLPKSRRERMLNKLILIVNDPEKLNSFLEMKIEEYKTIQEELQNMRSIKFSEFGSITKQEIKNLLQDLNASSAPKKKYIREIQLAKNIVGAENTLQFNELFNFLVQGDGKKYLTILKKKGIKTSNVSSILRGSGDEAIRGFKELYILWFDIQDQETEFLKTIKKEGFSLTIMTSILSGSGASAAQALQNLFDICFDKKGNKTLHLKLLEENGIGFDNIFIIFNESGADAPKALKDLQDLWFDSQGTKTEYFKNLVQDIDLRTICGILSGTKTNASKVFKELYDLWFDSKGNKTKCLQVLEKNGISLRSVSNILNGAGIKAPQTFKRLLNLWFHKDGNKTGYLKILEQEGTISEMLSNLCETGARAPNIFGQFCNFWFDEENSD